MSVIIFSCCIHYYSSSLRLGYESTAGLLDELRWLYFECSSGGFISIVPIWKAELCLCLRQERTSQPARVISRLANHSNHMEMNVFDLIAMAELFTELRHSELFNPHEEADGAPQSWSNSGRCLLFLHNISITQYCWQKAYRHLETFQTALNLFFNHLEDKLLTLWKCEWHWVTTIYLCLGPLFFWGTFC